MMSRHNRSPSYTGEAEPPAVDLVSGSNREEETPVPDRDSNEDFGLNSSERSTSDVISGHGKGCFLRYGTWNINTLYQAGKIDNCTVEMKANQLDVLGLAEVRWTESGKTTKKDTTLYYSGGDKHQNGVGIMIKKKYESAVNGFWPVSDRVVMIRMDGKPFDVVIIQVYAPTSTHSDQEIEDFYENIKKAIDQIKKTDILVVMGDLNAKIGKGKVDDIVGEYGLGERNERGDRLLQFCQENNMIITNTFYQHPNRNLYTWKSPGDRHRNQIDYIMIRKRFRNNIKNVKTYPGADMGGNCDHVLLVAKINIKMKVIKKRKIEEQLDYNMLKQQEIKDRYAVEVNNIYNTLNIEEGEQEESVEEEVEKKFNLLKESIHTASKNTLEKKKRKQEKEWMTEEIMKLIEDRKELKKPDQENQTEEYNEIDKKIKDECRLAKDKWFNEQCEEVMKLEKDHNIREMHNKVKDLTKKKKGAKSASSCIMDEEGKMLFTDEEIKKRWKDYVANLYDDPDRPEAEEIIVSEQDGRDMSIEEVKKAIKRMKNGKASGVDEIKTEHLKALDQTGLENLTALCNKIYNTGYIPKELRHSLFITIPKKKNAQMCSDHRTISLMSHITKILLSVIIERNKEKIDREISDSQSGFRTGIGTREGIFNIRSIVEKRLAVKKKVYACFIDYEKAFDRVYHSTLMKILADINIDSKDRRIIQNLYWKQTASIATTAGTSEEFEVKRGVRQGCVLSPMLFNLYTENIFREGLNGVRMGGEEFSNLRYADDTVLIADSAKELQKLVDEVKNRSLVKGLKMNVKKTKTMVIRKNVKSRCKVEITVDGKVLEQVKQYLYLGHIITEDGKCEVEIKRRIEIARSNFISMKNLLTSRTLHLNTRKKLIKCYVLSTFLYASETWTINQIMWDKIEAFEMWMWRKCMKISYTEHKTNEEVLQMIDERRSLAKEIIRRKLQYFGHLIRRNGVQKRLLVAEVEGTRGRGRPKTTWLANIQTATGKSLEEMSGIAEDRKCWRAFIAEVLEEHATTR